MRFREFLTEEDYKFGPHEMTKEESAIIELFSRKEKVVDKDVHALAEDLNLDPHNLEGAIYAFLQSFFSKGRAMEKGFDNIEVREDEHKMGMEVEKEHSDNPFIVHRIVLDHLAEMPDYYTRLKKMEEEGGVKED